MIFRLIGGTSSIFGLLDAKHLDASVVSPLENIDGAVTAIILYMFFEFTGRSHVTDSIGIVERIGTATCLITLRADIKRIPCPNSKKLFKRIIAAIINANTDAYTFEQLKRDARGKKGLLQRIKDIFTSFSR